MNRPGFFNAVLRFAHLKYICKGSTKGMPTVRSHGQKVATATAMAQKFTALYHESAQGSSGKTMSRHDTFKALPPKRYKGAGANNDGGAEEKEPELDEPAVNSIGEALDLLMKDYLLPLIERDLYGAVAKHALATDEVSLCAFVKKLLVFLA